MELTITRLGDVITIFPTQQNLKGAVAALRAVPRPATAEPREPIEVPGRA
jgi:hypothetical protein